MTRRACRMTWTVAGVVIGCLCAAVTANAQPTTLAAYQDLALGCLTEAPDTVQTFRLDAPDAMPYLRTALADRWQHDGRVVFIPGTSPYPLLTYAVEEAGVAYARAGRGRLRRTVTLALRYTLTTADGRLLRDDRCRDTDFDILRRSDRHAVESEAFPETQAEAPRGGWTRRYVEPALLATATAITVFLFFNLRSERTGE